MNRLAFRVWVPEIARMIHPTSIAFANGEVSEFAFDDDGNEAIIIAQAGDRFAVMQSTGCLARDGNPIIEGDIVTYNRYRYQDGWYSDGDSVPAGSGTGVIEWDGMGFRVRTGNYGTGFGGPGEPAYESNNLAITLVLGNVYENPDLIPATIKAGTLKVGR